MGRRLEKELEEILRQAGELPPPPRRRRLSLPRRPPLGRLLTPGRLMVAGVVLLVAALVVRNRLPGLVGYLGWLGLFLLILAYVVFFRQARALGRDRPGLRWRGRPVDYGPREGGWRRWFRRR